MNFRGELLAAINMEEHKVWVETLTTVLNNYDERLLRDKILQLRMEMNGLPAYTGGSISKYNQVLLYHQKRWTPIVTGKQIGRAHV